MEEVVSTAEAPLPERTSGGVPTGAKTSEYYRTFDIPKRFDNPGPVKFPHGVGNPVFSCRDKFSTPPPRAPEPDEWFQGYGPKPQNPMYMTTANQYGSISPTVHTMPNAFHCRNQKFTNHLGKCGMYRDQGFNTSVDKSKV